MNSIFSSCVGFLIGTFCFFADDVGLFEGVDLRGVAFSCSSAAAACADCRRL
jgi:hypothetical protein